MAGIRRNSRESTFKRYLLHLYSFSSSEIMKMVLVEIYARSCIYSENFILVQLIRNVNNKYVLVLRVTCWAALSPWIPHRTHGWSCCRFRCVSPHLYLYHVLFTSAVLVCDMNSSSAVLLPPATTVVTPCLQIYHRNRTVSATGQKRESRRFNTVGSEENLLGTTITGVNKPISWLQWTPSSVNIEGMDNGFINK